MRNPKPCSWCDGAHIGAGHVWPVTQGLVTQSQLDEMVELHHRSRCSSFDGWRGIGAGPLTDSDRISHEATIASVMDVMRATKMWPLDSKLMSMSFPDKDQVREALVRDEHQRELDPMSRRTLAAVARAFVDGSLLPAKPDYEAAAREHAFQCRGERSIVDVINDDPGPAARRAARAIVDAALAGKQETGE